MTTLVLEIEDSRPVATHCDADVRWLNHYGFRPLGLPSLARGLSS